MSQAQRDLIDQIIVKIKAGVTTPSAASTWQYVRYEPVQHRGDGQWCAIWFAGEANRPEGNTSSTLGHLDQSEEYHVRYWTPAPEAASGLVVDEAAALLVEQLYEAVYDVLARNQTYPGTAQYHCWPVLGEIALGGTNEAKIRAFEIVLRASRARAFA